MAVDPLSPEAIYAGRTNIKFPGTQAQATAAEAAAQSRLNDAYAPITTTVAGGTIKVAT